MTAQQQCVTPSAAWHLWPWKWCATSTRTPSTSCQTTMARRKSQPCCQHASRTFWSTVPQASPWVWQPTSHRTTCARLPKAFIGHLTTLMPAEKSCLIILFASSRDQTSQQAQRFWAIRVSKRLTALAVASSPCEPSSTPKRSTDACAWSSPSCHTR